jgi:hypothetical protein
MSNEFPHVAFLMAGEYPGENGLWNPRDDGPPVDGGFQVNVFGTREHYLRLAEAVRRFAEQDTSCDGDHHEHFEGLFTADGKVRLHVILRKDDVGDSSWKTWFPKA